MACDVIDIRVSGQFVGRTTTLTAITNPPRARVKWKPTPGTNLGNFSLSEDTQTLTTVFRSPGQKGVIASCEAPGGQHFQLFFEVVDPPPPPPPPPPVTPYGTAESVPEIVFIANVPKGKRSQAFLKDAMKFHQVWGFKPVRFGSLGEIVTKLARSTESLARIRIVAHSNFDNGSGLGQLVFPLFPRWQINRSISKEMLRAWAESDARGLSLLCRGQKESGEVLEGLVDLKERVKPTPGQILTVLEHVLNALRDNTPQVLVPFGLEQRGALTPRGPISKVLIQRSVDMRMAKDQKIAPLKTALMTILEEILSSILSEGPSSSEARVLHDAILTVQLPIKITWKSDAEVLTTVKAANRAIRTGFREKLLAASGRFASASFIDIRGCLVGNDSDYLHAIAEFFGRRDGRPKVSAPNFFAAFPVPVSRFLNDSEVKDALNEPGVKVELRHWMKLVAGTVVERSNHQAFSEYLFRHAAVLPVPTRPGVKLYSTKESKKRHLERWLVSQWEPPRSAIAASLAEKWAKNVSQAVPVCILFNTDELDHEAEVAVLPDSRYHDHIISV